MIDFRYHVVSIIAVFLALSVGLVLGSSFLADFAKEDLNSKIDGIADERDAERAENKALAAEIGKLDSYIATTKPELVADKLKGRSVVLVNLPDADTDVTSATAKTLEESGATVTGTVSLRSNWVDPTKEAALGDAVDSAVTGATAHDRAAAALASALVKKTNGSTSPTNPGGATPTPGATATPPADPGSSPPPSGSAPTDGATTPNPGATSSPSPSGGATTTPGTSGSSGGRESALATLNRLKSAGFIEIKGNPEKGATLAVVVAASGPVKATDPARANSVYLGLSRTLDAADDGTVLAGDAASAQDGGTVFALRRDERAIKSVSTVDAADTNAGQVSVDWALVMEAETGRAGQYGLTGPDGWLPELPEKKPEKTGDPGKTENTS
ncbi:copper transporter [Yinghuangia sp. YIM S09857]|uniref:copper transporter n=1 Tax=Yinghuangia sp. YIM S09857 TaxID=3436929 RepID=UPI003F52F1B4